MKSICLIVLLLVLVFTSACMADKVTLDPNAPGAQAKAASGDAPDSRLAQRISYDSGYKRLHAVVEELNRLSNVPIACGSSTKDWRVRDIPVVVCVMDMPLGEAAAGDCGRHAHVGGVAEDRWTPCGRLRLQPGAILSLRTS